MKNNYLKKLKKDFYKQIVSGSFYISMVAIDVVTLCLLLPRIIPHADLATKTDYYVVLWISYVLVSIYIIATFATYSANNYKDKFQKCKMLLFPIDISAKYYDPLTIPIGIFSLATFIFQYIKKSLQIGQSLNTPEAIEYNLSLMSKDISNKENSLVSVTNLKIQEINNCIERLNAIKIPTGTYGERRKQLISTLLGQLNSSRLRLSTQLKEAEDQVQALRTKLEEYHVYIKDEITLMSILSAQSIIVSANAMISFNDAALQELRDAYTNLISNLEASSLSVSELSISTAELGVGNIYAVNES